MKGIQRSNKIALVLPYYGSFPIWLDAFLRSCAYNTSIDWMIFSENAYQGYKPANVHFFYLKKSELIKIISEKTSINHKLTDPHKLCDFKPLYGYIFEEYLKKYDYWGHCDLDIIWGNVETFLEKIEFQQYDVISSRRHAISGHFTLYRNIQSLKDFYSEVPNYRVAFKSPSYYGFDEGFFSFHMYQAISTQQKNWKVYWPARNCLDRKELTYMPIGWYWKSGQLKNYFGKSGLYIHLIDWKKSIKQVSLGNIKEIESFSINAHGIWAKAPVRIQLLQLYYAVITFALYCRRLLKIKKPDELRDGPNVRREYRVLNKD